MLDVANDIRSLSHFKRNTAQVLKKMKKSGAACPTVNGRAEVVVQDVAAYQRMWALAEQVEMMEFLREAKADADAGRVVDAREFIASLGKKKKAKKA